MLRDNLAGLIEPMFESAGAHASAVVQARNGGMLRVDRVANRRSEAILAPNFSVENGRQAENRKIAALAVNAEGRGSRAVRKSHRTIDPECLENPRPEGAEIYTNGERRFSISR